MIQLVDIVSGKIKSKHADNLLKTGNRISFQMGDNQVSGIISCLDIKWISGNTLYRSPTVNIDMSLIDIQFFEESS